MEKRVYKKFREIVPGEAANPAVQQGFNVVARMELEYLMDHFRYCSVLLESVGLDPETGASRNIGLLETVDLGFGVSRSQSRVKVEKGWVGYGIAHFQQLTSECG
uniref:Uncharacterized protein n=1 Tax=Fagus sylvatica TaxID=28930 RepID=A0A2N9IBB2_FAGSY